MGLLPARRRDRRARPGRRHGLVPRDPGVRLRVRPARLPPPVPERLLHRSRPVHRHRSPGGLQARVDADERRRRGASTRPSGTATTASAPARRSSPRPRRRPRADRRGAAHRHRPLARPDAPIVLLDADTGERWPVLRRARRQHPGRPSQATDQLLYVRPAKNFGPGSPLHRRPAEPDGRRRRALPAPDAFRRYRDRLRAPPSPAFEAVGAHMDTLFDDARGAPA